jgi:hypothetical protein
VRAKATIKAAWEGKRVRATIGFPAREGVVLRVWYPWAQARVRWADGTETNIDLTYLEIQR